MKRIGWAGLVSFTLVGVLVLWAANLTPEGLVPVISARFPGVAWIEADTLAEWMRRDPASKPLLLDTRTAEEFFVSHLSGAVRIDPARPKLDVIDPTEDRPIVVYCSIGYRSAAIAERLKAVGVGRVYNLRGGIFAWANEGRPIVRDGVPADAVHPYDALWGRLLRPELRASATR
jgi:rhodanese-related sulfurtransferase